MHARATVELRATPARVHAVLADLTTWPAWLDVVPTAVAVDGAVPAWRVRLGLRIGPIVLGRDVRLVKGVDEPGVRLGFHRAEADGRPHSAVALDVAMDALDDGRTRVDLAVDVEKRLPFLDLRRELDRRGPTAAARLQRLLDAGAAGTP